MIATCPFKPTEVRSSPDADIAATVMISSIEAREYQPGKGASGLLLDPWPVG